MALIVKKGTVNNISDSTSIIGRNGNVNTLHVSTFRIDAFPATLKSATQSSFADGDLITAVGAIKRGTLRIYAFRNDTTGAYDQGSITLKLILGILFLVMGIPLSFLLIGIPLVFYGCIILYEVYLGWSAKTLLQRS